MSATTGLSTKKLPCPNREGQKRFEMDSNRCETSLEEDDHEKP